MRRPFFLIGLIFLLYVNHVQAAWTRTSLANKCFVENRGQFNTAPGVDAPVLYGIENSAEQVFFTRTGITFLYITSTGVENEMEEAEAQGAPMDHDRRTVQYHTVTMHWQGANANVNVVSEQMATEKFAYNFPDAPEGVLRCDAFHKIVYQNLYPGVDVEYTFHPETGLKYDIILHPGANAAAINMMISGSDNIRLDGGNLVVESILGDIIDHAPRTTYASDASVIASSFVLSGSNLKFNLANYDATREVIIDPWLVSPGFTAQNKGYDVARQSSTGNMYVMGGYPRYEVKKYTSAGVLLYTYITNPIYAGAGSNYYGDVEVEPASGDFFISSGCCNYTVARINGTTQATMWSSASFLENWRLKYNYTNNQLLVGGYVLGTGQNIVSVNPANGAIISSASIIGTGTIAEVRSVEVAPNGSVFLIHVTGGISGGNLASNILSCNSSALAPTWNVQDGYLMYEEGAFYAWNDNGSISWPGMSFHGVNALATTNSFVYTYDGATIYKRDIATGAQLGTVAVPGGTADQNSGIAIDSCGNVFVGTQTSIREYDANLVFVTSQSTPGAVYDVIIGGPSEVIATGNTFVGSFLFPCQQSIAVNTTSVNILCNGQCTGSATATPVGGSTPFTYSWSNGGNTQTIGSLCAGNYSVTVTDAVGLSATSTVTVTEPPALSVSSVSPAAVCPGGCASVSASGSGGTPGYSYDWTPSIGSGAGPFTVCPPSTTVYTVEVTDANGCTNTATSTVTINTPPPAVITPAGPVPICTGTATLHASTGAGYTYVWYYNNVLISGQTLDSLVISATGDYSVVVTDANGCSSTSTPVTAVTGQGPVITLSTSGGQCNAGVILIGWPGSPVVITATAPGAVTYLWSPGGQTTSSITPTAGGTYSVMAWDANGCPSGGNDTITIVAVNVTCGHNGNKVILCHVPPGNPGNPQTICVDASAIPSHLANHPGDCVGPCSLYYAPRVNPGTDPIVGDIEQAFYIDAYPNPFNGTFSVMIHSSMDSPVNVKIYDMTGRVVESYVEINEKTAIGGNLKAGVYTIEAEQQGITQRQRIVKE